MNRKHANISIFVPHIGCPNRCSFCDQRSITGTFRAPNGEDVKRAVSAAVKSKNYVAENTEIAFFGGSFTAINRNYMKGLLEVASQYVKDGTVKGIRISTRPDAVDEEILSVLKEYGVTAIELGAQSLDDNVLRMNNRGHKANDVINASKLIKENGFELGLQMMTGLYGDSDETAIKTALRIAQIKPETVRIYPTIVLKNTDLEALFLDKKYEPQSLESAVLLSVKLLEIFKNADIKVIRLGLHSIESGSYVAGPWHPAFSELCLAEIYYQKALKMLNEKGNYKLFVNNKEISKMVGQRGKNIERLADLGFKCKVSGMASLSEYEIITERTD